MRLTLALLSAGSVAIFTQSVVQAQTPPADVTIVGEGADDDFGWRATPAGDVNGDGVADLIVGAPSNDAVDGFAGRAYLFYGPFAGNLNAADADAIISAEAFGDNLGFSVSSAGDVNGDGFDDIIIGARSNDTNGIQSGRVCLFYGPISGSLAATDADAIISGDDFDEVGRAIAGAGDLNGDGFDDIVIGTDIAGVSSEGRAFIFNGPLSGERTADSADAVISGSFANESFGASVASAGDVNGDGVNDIIIGAPRFPLDGADTGRAYIFYGPITGSLISTDADVTIFGEDINDSFGTSVAGAGDLNGDGVADVVVGADQLYNEGAGKAYVFNGPLSGPIQAVNAEAIINGEASEDLFGVSVSGVGDFNGDGFDDIAVGAWNNGAGGVRSGRAYTFFGPVSGNIAALNANFIVTGASGDQLGVSVAGGDLDGDGVGDLIVGAPQFIDGDPGYTLVYFGQGQDTGLTLTLSLRDGSITIPPEGGSFRYRLEVENSGNITRRVDIWLVLTGPDTERLLARFSRTMGVGETLQRTFTQAIPGVASAGTYTVTGNVGRFPIIRASDSLQFEKLP